MDTKPLELEALNQIQSLVSRYDYHIANPNYDVNGGDFFIFEERGGGICFLLKCQSKGRDISSHASNVSIPQSYVVKNFLVFVYAKPEDVDQTKVYLFTAEDILNDWRKKGNDFILYLSQDFNRRTENEKYLLNKERAKIIEVLLAEVSRKTSIDYIYALNDSDFYFTMWQKTGGLPSIEYTRDIFSGDDFLYIGMAKFIFLLCASVIKNDNSDFSLSIDWAFECLKEVSNDEMESLEYKEGREYHSDVAITYGRTWVREMLSEDGTVKGFLLHIGDSEESVEAYVIKDGDYGIVYFGRESDIIQ